MTPAIFRHQKWFPDGNINIISNGGGLTPISETGSYGRPQGHINCLRVRVMSVTDDIPKREAETDDDVERLAHCNSNGYWNPTRLSSLRSL